MSECGIRRLGFGPDDGPSGCPDGHELWVNFGGWAVCAELDCGWEWDVDEDGKVITDSATTDKWCPNEPAPAPMQWYLDQLGDA